MAHIVQRRGARVSISQLPTNTPFPPFPPFPLLHARDQQGAFRPILCYGTAVKENRGTTYNSTSCLHVAVAKTLNPCPNPMDVGWAAKALDSLDFRHKMLMLQHRQRVRT